MPDPIDPLKGPRYALEGKVVTMDDDFTVLDRGVVYINKGQIEGIKSVEKAPPDGFEETPVIKTGGTIFPGLIELHNHLSYNVLPLWDVPEKYPNRSKWGGTETYRKLISGPMQILGKTQGYVEAIVRYVECKCLMSGVTTSQGIALYSNQGIRRYYRGIVRNVEETDQADLPEARTKISDVEASKAEKFLESLQRSSCLLLHLSEGIDERAHDHFKALHLDNGEWAITQALSGIHCVGLKDEDFIILKEHGASMVWSPLSNMLLYGETADIRAAKAHNVLMGIGSDWSPSGSKNLLGELKVAKLVSDELGGVFADQELVAMATRNAAKILKWDAVIGSIEPDKRADLFVISGRRGNPYTRLFNCRESSIGLVIINGIPRCGQTRFMNLFGEGTEKWRVRTANRVLNLEQETADPIVGSLTLLEAQKRLVNGMRQLPELAADLERPRPAAPRIAGPQVQEWFLLLDHNEIAGEASRPHLPRGPSGQPTGVITSARATAPLSEIVEVIDLDPLTVVDDNNFLKQIASQRNLPNYVKEKLPEMY